MNLAYFFINSAKHSCCYNDVGLTNTYVNDLKNKGLFTRTQIIKDYNSGALGVINLPYLLEHLCWF